MKKRLVILLLALQSAWVIATVAVEEFKLHRGEVVLLETAPVDPRDLLRGDYVILNYKINSVPASRFSERITNSPPEGTPVFVRLEKRGVFHEIETVALSPFQPEQNHPVIRGKTANAWRWPGANGTNATIRVEYGLERFYVREGTGTPRGKLTAEIAIPSSGNAIIKQVFIDGKPFAQAMHEQPRP